MSLKSASVLTCWQDWPGLMPGAILGYDKEGFTGISVAR